MMDDVNPTTNEHGLVRECLTEIFRFNGYDDVAKLTQRDYEHISNTIEAKTTILISVSTLKRLLHGEFTRIPQTATLNAISTYLGYKSWQDYKLSFRKKSVTVIPKEPVRHEIKVQTEVVKPPSNTIKRITVMSVGIVCVIVAVLFIRYAPGNSPGNFDKASFSAEKTTSNDIPNTVVFHYNIDDVKADSFFIQQSWDVNRRVRIYKNKYTLTDIYYEPGYHLAKLIANDSIIKTVDVSIPSDGWFLFAMDPQPKSNPEYIKPTVPLVKNGVMILDEIDLTSSHIDKTKEKKYVYTLFPSEMHVQSDNYIFKTRVRMRELRNNFCPTLMVEVWTQRYFNFFQSTSKGCVSEAMAEFGENFLSGKNNDLSALGYDLTEWVDVEWMVKNRQVTISFNGKVVLEPSYKKDVGYITGIAFISNGLPEIDYIELKGLDGSVVYENDFSEAAALDDN
ncbi:MAG TPA: hypothetical protein VK589_21780 [Chryseolinea sp.]|nr:hypothetical protein [Chryseolinea sp.]